MKRQRDIATDYEVDRWTVEWWVQYERLMARITAAHGNPHQLCILELEAEALAQAGRDRLG